MNILKAVVHFKWENCMVFEYYLNKVVTNKKEEEEGLIRDLNIKKATSRQLEVATQRECYRARRWELADP